jgi:hypothetical protein
MNLTRKILSVIIFSIFMHLKVSACTSFAVYSSEIWYGMNFDYANVEMKFSINIIGNKKVFKVQFGSGGYIAGMNDSGLFTNYQMLYYNNERPIFDNSSNTIGLGPLNEYSLNIFSTVAQVSKYIGTKKLVPSFGQDLHTLFADNTGNAFIAEPFGPVNGIVPVKDSFIVMTNLPHYDFIGNDYNSVYGVGSERFQTAYEYIQDNKSAFNLNNGIEVLRQTAQSTGDYPTQISLVFDPVKMEVYFCLKQNYTKVWKVSIKNGTIETYSGFTTNKTQKLGSTAITASQLLADATTVEENSLFDSDNKVATIYPNPTKGLITVSFSSTTINQLFLEIINTEGKQIVSRIYKNTTSATIDLTGYPKGMYLLKAVSNHNINYQKICLE